MMPYLLKSGLCLLVLLGFYKLLLERERMARFNRYYLLGSLAVGLLAPLLVIEIEPAMVPLAEMLPVGVSEPELGSVLRPVAGEPRVVPMPHDIDIWQWVYWLITALLLGRFGQNLYRLFRTVTQYPTRPLGQATLVLLPRPVLPHTFLHYLFVSQAEYKAQRIEGELFVHELAHIRQRHSLDILLIEGLLCFGWFNPLLFGFKRAIQLNHEFLADEAVTNQWPDIAHYQRLLLAKLTNIPAFPLTSSLTFQTTKQRFVMMNKQTSPARRWLMAGCSGLLLAGLSVAVSTQSAAQQPAAQTSPKPQSTTPPTPARPGNLRIPNLTVA
jgi:bla regulator protein blaR1